MIIIIKIMFNFLYYVLLVRVLLSWFPYFGTNKFNLLIFQLTEPLLAPIRNIIPRNSTGVDFSPLILFIILNFLKSQLFILG